MSIGFNWFKEYKIEITDELFYRDVSLEYIGGEDTSHSGGNIGKVQDLITMYGGKRIPSICADFIQSEDEKLDLVEPKEMSHICEKILKGKEVDEVDMRNRIEWFKELSDDGYYLSYDYE
jgi:hypothetical protein